MVSRVQLEANMANAKRSTGPKTERGKARSKMNALKHGLTGKAIVVADEDPREFETFREDLEADLGACGLMEREWVGRIAGLLWRLRRVPRMEAALIRCEIEDAEDQERDKLYDEIFPSDSEEPEGQERLEEMTRVLNEPVSDDDDEALARLKEMTRPDSPELARQKQIDRAFGWVVSQSRLELVQRYETSLTNELKRTIAMLQSLQAARMEREHGRVIESISIASRSTPKLKGDKESV